MLAQYMRTIVHEPLQTLLAGERVAGNEMVVGGNENEAQFAR